MLRDIKMTAGVACCSSKKFCCGEKLQPQKHTVEPHTILALTSASILFLQISNQRKHSHFNDEDPTDLAFYCFTNR